MLRDGARTNRSEMVYNLKMEPPMGAVRLGAYKLMFAKNFTKDNWYDIDSVSLPESRSPRTGRKVSGERGERGRRRKFNDLFKEKTSPNTRRHRQRRMNQQFLKRTAERPVVGFSQDRVWLRDPAYAENIFGITAKEEEEEDEEEYSEEEEVFEFQKNYQKMFDKKWPELQKHLFNVVEDPEERVDLQESHPEILERLRSRVRELYGSFIASDFPAVDHRGSPKHFHGVWSTGWC